MRRGRREGLSGQKDREAFALPGFLHRVPLEHFASRASVDSVQFLDSVHSVTVHSVTVRRSSGSMAAAMIDLAARN
jgi:hypothetical protein